MIIACPECEGPFEVRDGDIAELVQIECPHCRFRMILDFAAANDASLVEAGMRMASGFRSAADYRRAAGAPAGIRVAEAAEVAALLPEIAAPPPEIAAQLPEVAAQLPEVAAQLPVTAPPPVTAPEPDRAPVAPAAERVSPPTAVPVAPPASVPAPVAPPVAAAAPAAPRPIVPIGLDDDDASETIVRTPAVGRPTVIGMAPPPARTETRAAEAETEPARSRADALAQAGVPEPIDAPPPRTEAPVARPTPRPTPVTPPREPATTPAAATPATATPRARPARIEAPAALDEAVEPEPRRSGAFGTVVLMILLLTVVGLTAASIVRKNTPDPRPLLEDLYRQYVAP
jgi:hypothetical protein